MKTRLLLTAIFGTLVSPGFAAEAPASTSRARLTGPLADGTPPAPEPEKPKFIVRSKNVLSRETHFEGGRKITVQEITPIDLPPPPEAVTPRELSPVIRELMAQQRAANAKKIHLPLSASIYRSATAAPRTLVTYSPPPEITAAGTSEQTVTQVPAITFWSSADFIGSDGQTRSVMLAWSTYDLESIRTRSQKFRKVSLIPTIPPLPEGPATFLITHGSPRPQDLAAIQSLHDLYNNELPRLQTAYQGRERLRLAQEAELNAHPPQPQDLILNHWRTPFRYCPAERSCQVKTSRSLLTLVASLWILASQSSHAIHDENTNGLSDTWEKTYNGGTLFPNTFLPTADPDGDGWTNEQEADANTDPLNANPPNGHITPDIEITPATYWDPNNDGISDIDTPECATITWTTQPGTLYRLQYSTTLAPYTWENADESYLEDATLGTTDCHVVLTQPNGQRAEKLFWRVQVTSFDRDLDNLTNAEEYRLGTNPYNAYTDSDLLSDYQEVARYQTDPTNSDSDDDGTPDDADPDTFAQGSGITPGTPSTSGEVTYAPTLKWLCAERSVHYSYIRRTTASP